MPRRLITTGSEFERQGAYSRAVVDGEFVFVSGCTGFDYATGAIADTAAAQAEQVFRNIRWALAQAGASLADVVQIALIVADRRYYAEIAHVLRAELGEIRPASTAWVAPLVDERIKVEIAVTARHGS